MAGLQSMWWILLTLSGADARSPSSRPEVTKEAPSPSRYLDLLDRNATVREAALADVTRRFDADRLAMALEVSRFADDPDVVNGLWTWVARGTRTRKGDRDGAFRWLWSRPYTPSAGYLAFKADLYERVDPRFRAYFEAGPPPRIRMDEVRWGGVRRDGIPPLRNPKLLAADEAAWLADTDVVFGTVVNGEAHAFPKRILAWHELLTMEIGGTPIVGVYCTLCGSMIVYDATVDGVTHELGTSGFLYRSNKLMYDRATSSLWTTLGGYPVAGPLVGQDVELPMRSVVTTTWGEWRRRHPKTQVLSVKTGHFRDYREGAAYRDYFATDDLMFTVPDHDDRLANKAEVLALRRGRDRVALAVDYLKKHPVHHETVGGVDVVVLTDASGAARAYEAPVRFAGFDGDRQATDAQGDRWTVTEAGLVEGDRRLARVPAHRAFWFGWHAAWPETRLVR